MTENTIERNRPAEINGLGAFLIKSAAIPLLLGGIFFIIFFVTALSSVRSTDLSEYAFGADTPYFVDMFRNPPEINKTVFAKHPLVVGLAALSNKTLLFVSDPVVKCKLIFSIFAALNIVFACKVFQQILPDKVAILSTISYGFSGGIWYFSSFPESYTLTTLLVTLYIYNFVRHIKNPLASRAIIISAIVLALGTLTEIIFPLVFIIPLMYYRKKLFRDLKFALLLFSPAIYAGITVVIVLAILFNNMGSFYIGRAVWFLEQNNFHKIADVVADVLFFNVGFPDSIAVYGNDIPIDYKGFFNHSPIAYFSGIMPAIFFVVHIGLIGTVVYSFRENRDFIFAFGIFILLRACIIYQFNVFEAILYTAPLNLALMIILTTSVVKALNKKSSNVLAAYALVILAANTPFFLNHISL